jgi:hypothetical protein
LSGNGCPLCAEYGFNPSKPAWIYVLIFANFIKYGITNNLGQRLCKHKLNGEYTVALSKLYEDGSFALDWENYIKKTHGGKFVTKNECPDGWTETLCVSKLSDLLKIDIT